MTAGQLATATGRKRTTISTLLSNLAKAGVVVKAHRGYQLPRNLTSATTDVRSNGSEPVGDGSIAERKSPISSLRSELDAALRTRV